MIYYFSVMKIFVAVSLFVLTISKPQITLMGILFLISVLSIFINHPMDPYMVPSGYCFDSLAISMVSLTLFIISLMILSSIQEKTFKKFSNMALLVIMLLLVILVLAFSTSNLIYFYILFEASLVPTFLLILGWGGQPERSQAGIYMLLYTVLASLPLLASILVWSNISFNSNFFLLNKLTPLSFTCYFWSYTLIMAFAVKLPLFVVHLWLPKAHVEAPVAGSMILAAILLKLGGYGILRISNKSMMVMCSLSPAITSWALVGGSLISVLCVFQSDVKLLIALSSVAHMSLVMAGVLSFSTWGINGALFIMVGHGFCSSGLFCVANLFYCRLNSRSLFVIKGLQMMAPAFALGWFMLCTSNMASPPSLNLLGEMNSIMAIFSWSENLCIFLAILVFMAAAYSLFLFSQTQHGKLSTLTKFLYPFNLREWLLLFSHWLPLNILFLAPASFQIFI